MIAWFARNHVAANLLMVTILFTGLMSLKYNIPLEVFPSFETDTISVNVSLRGATPEDAELSLATRVEEAVSDLEGVKQINSRSVEGGATITIEVDSGYDARELLADVKSRVDEIGTFPSEADQPVISLATFKRDVITVAVAGELSEQELRGYAERVRDDLLRTPGITQVELDGVRNYEIAIELSQDQLRAYDLTLSEVAERIGNSSLDLSAGNIRTDGGDILIRSKGQAYYRDQFEPLVIKANTDGSLLRLRDIANVTDGFEESALRTRFNGKPAAMLDVYRVGDQSAIEVADKVKAYVHKQQANLPQGLELSYWGDGSLLVKSRIKTLTTNALQGGILVLLLLTLFLRPSIAFWVFIGIPVSFMGAFLVMPLFGVTLNVLSLFGFILVLGIVVDDAIVTGENIYSHLRNAESGLQASIRGTQEVAVPVTFGVLTTVAAFLPIGFIEGARGALFAQIPVVVIPVLLFSLIESKFVLPAHLKHLKLRQNEVEQQGRLSQMQQRFADGFERMILKYYQPLLALSLKHRLTTLALFSGVFILILAFILSGWTRFVFFPRVEADTARASLTMPSGTPFEVTDRHIVRMVEAARALQEDYRDPNTGESVIMNIFSTTGAGGSAETGRIRFELQPAEEREQEVSASTLINEWRERIGPIPGAETLTFRAEIGRASDPVSIELRSGDVDDLRAMAQQVKARLETYPTLFDIADNLSDGKEELQLELTPQAHLLGLTRSDIIRQVRQNFFGIEVQRVQRGRDDVRVMVRLPLEERQAIAGLKGILINTPGAGQVPLDEVAQLVPGKSPSAIYRVDQYRTANVVADMDKVNTNTTVLNRDLNEFLTELVLQYPGAEFSLEGEAEEQRESFASLALGLAFVFFVIYSLLAIPFRSYLQPLIVMSVIPFGAIGAIVGHWIMGMDLTIMSLLGLMALIGVVVNDSLVLVDFTNQRRKELQAGGEHSHFEATRQAVLVAGVARFRPVMLTSLTTFIGLMPLLFEKAVQAQFLIPMAVSLGFGIIFATVVTLIMVPVNFMLLEDLRRLGRRLAKRPEPVSTH
ncbi:efflux RND transporter permease subunit [Marinobacterium iners]|jgi:multidrug efflux pump subunit AcrB|uniref:Multidrug efflux pump subunit AcrB n=1 Tax=Marinobacterium iners DSM 11526 TaxID=1122198 RepID=A0A1H4FYZ0_9GAMM|nr:efflux RND transporter permease subunit [Marinobacterium iners]SEB02573.1 Multidrug efflux pump subunit AcrB [Marinobacterium iners DSM 11526]